jgi:hypothetical protein
MGTAQASFLLATSALREILPDFRTPRQMINKENYLGWIVRASIAVFSLWSCSARAETPCFRIEGLKYIETVHLDVTGSKASGDYLVDEYGENAKRFDLPGKWFRIPLGRRVSPLRLLSTKRI